MVSSITPTVILKPSKRIKLFPRCAVAPLSAASSTTAGARPNLTFNNGEQVISHVFGRGCFCIKIIP